MCFLISSAVACFAIYLATVAKEEMVEVFAKIVAFISLFLSLILAPWLGQISILIFVLLWQHPHR